MNEVTVSGDTATINFNKKVENFTDANVKFYLDYVNDATQFVGTVKTTEGSTDKVEVQFENLITPGNHKIIVRYADADETKIEDLLGNKLTESEMAFEVENDTAATTLSKVEYKNTNIIEVTFDKDVEGADKSDAYELKNSKGEKITISNVAYNKNDKKATLTVGKIKLTLTLTFSKIDGKDNFTTNPAGNLKVIFADDVDQEDPCHLDKVTVRQVGKIADMEENELKEFSAEAKVFEAAPAATTLKIDYATEKVTGFNASTIEVANDAAFENKIADFDGTIVPGQTIYVRVKATSNAEAGAVQTITAGARPTASTVYEVKLTDGEWVEKTANESGEITGLEAGNYKVKLKATESNFKSEEATVDSVTAS